MKEKLEKINYLFLIILPFIDLFTALSARYLSISLSIGVLMKGVYTVYLAIYIIFFNKSKNKKNFIYYTVALIIYSLLYVLTKKHIWDINLFIKEFVALYKFLFTGYILFAFLIINKDNKNNYNKILLYSLICYVLLLIIPELTNTSFKSYMHKNNEGSVGWFYAANEISAIILILFPFYFSRLKEKILNKKYLYCLFIVPVIYSIFIIGTKTSWYGLIILSIIIFIIYLLKERENKKLIIFSLMIITTLLLINKYSPANSNLISKIDTSTKEQINNNDNKNSEIKETTNKNKCGKYYKIKTIIKNEKIYKPLNSLMSGRENKAYTVFKIYQSSPLENKIFGLGFTNNTIISNCYVERYIEIDLLDAIFHYGIIGLILILYPFIILFKQINYKKIINSDSQTYIYILTAIMILGLSFLSGHILGYPTPSIYLSLLLIIIVNKLQ